MATALASRQTSISQHRPHIAHARPSYLRPLPTRSAADIVAAGLNGIGATVSYARGKTVIEEGNTAEYVYKVVSGALRAVRLLPDGRRHITSFLMPGDFFGFTDGAEYSHSVEAVADVTLVRYSRRGFEALLDKDPRIGHHFFGLVCQKLSATQERLLLLGRKSALERMATFLLAMADRQTDDGSEVDLPMNRADVADYLGLTIETVSRLLSQLRGRRIIEVPAANRIMLRRREALEEISSGEA